MAANAAPVRQEHPISRGKTVNPAKEMINAAFSRFFIRQYEPFL
jgi:hypothetical protein